MGKKLDRKITTKPNELLKDFIALLRTLLNGYYRADTTNFINTGVFQEIKISADKLCTTTMLDMPGKAGNKGNVRLLIETKNHNVH